MTTRMLHTERLDLLPWEAGHERRLLELATIPEVARSISRGRPWDPSSVLRIAESMERHWKRYDSGWRAVTERSTGIVAGFVGVAHAGVNEEGLDPEAYEFGCWLHPSHWRRGLGIEASTAVLDEAFAVHGATAVYGCAPNGHQASFDGATALGFVTDRRTIAEGGLNTLVLRLDAEAWARRRPMIRS